MFHVVRALRHVLGPRAEKRLYGLIGLAVIGAGLEMLGIGSIPMFLGVLTGVPGAMGERFMSYIPFRGGNSREVLVFGACMLFALFVVKNTYLALLSAVQSRFTWSTQARLSQRLFRGKLECPWGALMSRHSADALNHSSFQAIEVAQLVLRPILALVSEGLVIIVLLLLLIWWEPTISLVAATILAGSVSLFLRFSRRTLDRFARELQRHRAAMIRIVQDSMGGAKIAKVLGREAALATTFAVAVEGHAQAARVHQFTADMPRLFVECASMLGLLLVAVLLVAEGREVIAIIPTLGLLAVALVRLIPSFNRVTVAVTSLHYGLESLKAIDVELREVEGFMKPKSENDGPIPFETSITLDHVSFRYASDAPFVLHDICMEVPRGSVAGIMGESGCGKTTLVDLIVGLHSPASGHVHVDGVDVAGAPRAWQRRVGYVPQEIYLADDSIRRNIAFGLQDEEIDEVALHRALQTAHMDPMLRDLPQGIDTLVGERGVRLSGGQRQRIGIARALYQDPDLLIFDEATSALDNESEACILETIARLRRGKTIILVAHRATTVRDCDILFRMSSGRLIAVDRLDAPAPRRSDGVTPLRA